MPGRKLWSVSKDTDFTVPMRFHWRPWTLFHESSFFWLLLGGPEEGSVSTRRKFLESAGALVATQYLTAAYAMGQGVGKPYAAGVQQATLSGQASVEMEIASIPFSVDGRTGRANTVNGSLPGPILRLREGQDAVIHVRNRLPESTSIHWHGILLPPAMDGVPGVSFAGIPAGGNSPRSTD